MPEKSFHYIVSDADESIGSEYLSASSKEEAVRKYVEMYSLEDGYDGAVIGVVLKSDIDYYEIEEQTGYKLRKQP